MKKSHIIASIAFALVIGIIIGMTVQVLIAKLITPDPIDPTSGYIEISCSDGSSVAVPTYDHIGSARRLTYYHYFPEGGTADVIFTCGECGHEEHDILTAPVYKEYMCKCQESINGDTATKTQYFVVSLNLGEEPKEDE